MITPEAPIPLKGNQDCSFNAHQPRSDEGNQLQKSLQVGEAALGKSQGRQQLLVAPLFTAEAVEQTPQRSHRLVGRG